MIRELRFTPENLRRHLNCPQFTQYKTIYTTRLLQKGSLGDIFHIPGVPNGEYFVLVNIRESEPSDYFIEGFTSSSEYASELNRIYGQYHGLWLHNLLQLNTDIDLINCSNPYVDMLVKCDGK